MRSLRRLFLSSFILSVLVLFISSVTVNAQPIIKIDGSSTVFPITEGVAEDFQKAKKGAVKITVGISGTGGGFKRFCRGETDISNASRPIMKKEIEACKEAGIRYIELPIAYDALSVFVNVKNKWIKDDCITIEQLKKMWEPDAQGKITKWNQVDPSWPDKNLRLAGPGADSGTFDYFTEAVVGKAKASRGDYVASEDDNVIMNAVIKEEGGLGYVGLAYVLENKGKVKPLSVKNPKTGKCVLPSDKTVMDGSYQPLSRPLFIYINEKAAKERPEVKEFVDYYLKNAAKISKQVGYIPLPAKAYDLAAERFKKMHVGTVFGGEPQVGLTVEELLKREAKY
ncbi:MAG: PstS family phosphate ABC transporter substrate-binding protein [Thermodesulfovibrio sp.]|nr:PstS family phosphate ABC transporter substrate-binding protein [Thermodesulfovibrio sp.]MDW7999307.1 PstS family phosphate ABC transporter substrate-binding protein [Thermodesulfovibrio sp.]